MGLRLLQGTLLLALSLGAPAEEPLEEVEPAPTHGRVVVLPGIYNTRFHLRGFAEAAEAALPPEFSVEIRPWGVPFLGLYNLQAEKKNLETAQRLADELTEWRRDHPDAALYLVGYSGGGGMAALVVSALPADVGVERLILVAPAISPDFPLATDVLPKVDEFAVNYASQRDLQVGWGTRVFGTIGRERTVSAGAIGFTVKDLRLLEWHWTSNAGDLGHAGNHLGYLSPRWQAAALLPAIDPKVDAEALRRRLEASMNPGDFGDQATQ